MEGFLTQRWDIMLPGWGGTAAFARGATLAARWIQEPQPINNRPVGLGFPRPAGRYPPGRSAFTSTGSWSCQDKEGFLAQGRELARRNRCVGPRGNPRRALAPEAPANHNRPVGLGFKHPVGRYRPVSISLTAPGCCSCRDVERFLTCRWELIFPGCGGPWRRSEGQTSPRAGLKGPNQSVFGQ